MSWKKYRISELCTDIIDCVNKTAPISANPTPFHMLRTSDIRDGFINLENLNCVTEETFVKWSRRGYLQNGDIIFTREAPLGEVGLVRQAENYFLGQRLVLYRANPDVCDNLFLLYWFLNPQNKESIKQKGVGSTVTHLRVPECEAIEVIAPDLKTQRKIGEILSAYDDLIENNRKQIKLLEEAAQRLYKEWFVDLRFPGWEDAEIVDGVPVGWRTVSIDDLGDYINGYAFKPSDWGTVGKPIIKIKEMNEGITKDTPRNIGSEIPEKYNISSGDILFSWSATLAVLIWHSEDGLLNQHLFKVVPNTDCGREFVYQSILLSLPAFHNLTTGATMKHLQRGKLKEAFVLKPDQVVMSKFECTANEYRKMILVLEDRINLLKEARDRLLPKLMSGEMEV